MIYFFFPHLMVGVWWKKEITFFLSPPLGGGRWKYHIFSPPTHLQVVGGDKSIDFHDLQHYMVVNGGFMIDFHAQPN